MAEAQQTDPAEFTHTERIECPECGLHQDAKVEHTWPFWSYVHFCERPDCGHTILESEWQRV